MPWRWMFLLQPFKYITDSVYFWLNVNFYFRLSIWRVFSEFARSVIAEKHRFFICVKNSSDFTFSLNNFQQVYSEYFTSNCLAEFFLHCERKNRQTVIISLSENYSWAIFSLIRSASLCTGIVRRVNSLVLSALSEWFSIKSPVKFVWQVFYFNPYFSQNNNFRLSLNTNYTRVLF